MGNPTEHYWHLFTDGASKGNPGEAGAGWVLIDPTQGRSIRRSRFLGTTTNNEAEYRALLLGLQEAASLKVPRLRIFMDSELLVRQLNGSYRVRNPRLAVLFRAVQELLKGFSDYVIMHIPREENREADRLANEAIKEKGRRG